MRYLAGTSNFGIQYKQGVRCVLEGFVDNDWSGNRIGRALQVLSLIWGLVVCWASKKKEIVAFSTSNALYITLCTACYHGVSMKKVFNDCEFQCEEPVQMW